MGLTDKLNKAKELAKKLGKNFNDYTAIKIFQGMTELGYKWDSTDERWVSNLDAPEEFMMVKVSVTGHPRVLDDFLPRLTKLFKKLESERFLEMNTDKPRVYPITGRIDKELAKTGFKGATYKLTMLDE